MKIEKELVMTSINSILCDDVTIPAAGSRITYTYISGENADGEFELEGEGFKEFIGQVKRAKIGKKVTALSKIKRSVSGCQRQLCNVH